MRIVLTFILCVIAFSGCAEFHQKDVAVISKSQNDDREYRYLLLDNGLKVMLVSDPGTDFSAASLDVYVGSSSDPEDRQGLAHFLEHMLFLGTEKYPGADSYGKYLKDNGGNHNAYTSLEHTNYFFDVKPESLDSTLDRFAQFFISPLLDEAYVEREKHAVHSEYKAGIKDESRRGMDVLRQVMNPEHPFNQFSVGSLETLSSSKKPIKDDLVKFYQQHYLANNMALAVLGKESLDELEIMVKEKFTLIKSGHVEHKNITEPIFQSQKLPEIVYFKPEKNLRELNLLFPIPDQVTYYRSQPAGVIAHVLGHEGKGSLLSYLKNKNWVESLSASQAFAYSGGGVFNIDISLTEEGLIQKDQVILAVFQAIKRLQAEGIPKSVFDEIARINDLEFAFMEERNPQGYVLSIANALHYYPYQDVLSAGYHLDQYKPQLIQDTLQNLTISNSLIMVVTDQFEPAANSDFYNVPYKVVPMNENLQKEIMQASANPDIRLPGKNTLLPEELAIPEDVSKQDKPRLLVKKEGFQLWHKPLQDFRIPKATSYLSFRKEGVRATVEASVRHDLYIKMLNDSFNEWIYPAQMAGLSLQLYGQVRGITLKIDGFSDKQDELLVDTFDHIKAVNFETAQFERIKAGLLKDWQNAEKQKPYVKLMSKWMETLQKPAWSAQDKIAALTGLQLQDIQLYGDYFWHDIDVMAMTNGNITEQQSREMLLIVEKFIPQLKEVKSDVLVVKLAEANQHSIVSSEHEDAGYFLYWQAADNDIASQAKYMLLAKAIENNFFNELRTEQQLGYVVNASYASLLSVPGLAFMVQSPAVDVTNINQSVMEFLQESGPALKEISPEYLLQLQQALRQGLLEKPLSLVDESEAYWYDLAMGYTGFDRKQQLAEAISAVTIADWQAFISSLFAQPFSRMYLLSTPTRPVNGYRLIEELKAGDKAEYFYYR
jgi:insulysin